MLIQAEYDPNNHEGRYAQSSTLLSWTPHWKYQTGGKVHTGNNGVPKKLDFWLHPELGYDFRSHHLHCSHLVLKCIHYDLERSSLFSPNLVGCRDIHSTQAYGLWCQHNIITLKAQTPYGMSHYWFVLGSQGLQCSDDSVWGTRSPLIPVKISKIFLPSQSAWCHCNTSCETLKL